MKIVRFLQGERNIRWGVLHEDRIKVITGDVYSDFRISEEEVEVSSIKLLAPCTPEKIVCVGLNYYDHTSTTTLEEPILFLKPPSSVNHHNGDIVYPEISSDVQYEAELAVIIGKKAKFVDKDEVAEYILGYSCANDITARDLQIKDGQWTRGKSFDTFAPIGPWIETELDPHNINIKLYVNNKIRQSSNTNQLIFTIPELIEFITQVMTLEPGDVILTGTPAGTGQIFPGERVVVEIEKIGQLANTLRVE
jgi:2-keto-4-pentenoate hydratase/2-oxohepta-3-ene-1,7-dioic acid hydratase in catechol pathway